MTAVETFFQSIAEGNLPAAVPVVTTDGSQVGLCSAEMEFKDSEVARSIVMSTRPRERAVAALYALQSTVSQLQEHAEVKPLTEV